MEKFIFLVLMINYGSASQSSMKSIRHGVDDPFFSSQNLAQFAVQSSSAEQYFFQKLDHFNCNDKRVWQQRYWKTDQYYVPLGPAFLWMNGEYTATPSWIIRGQYLEYAQKLGAMAFSLEHRFYGNSRPLPDTSTENLAYLSSEQATADIANFIQGMNKLNNLPQGTKWFVFGGSYAGSLVAWARLRYPDVIHGAVASSAPLFAKLDFKEYHEVVRNVLASYSENCPKVIEQATKQMEDYLKDETGRKKLTEIFRLCDPFENNPDDISTFFNYLSSFVDYIVQYNKDNRDSLTNDITVETICDILDKENTAPITLYGQVNSLMLKVNNGTCINTRYQDYINDLKLVDYESAAESSRQWFYQDCTEFGYYQTSEQPTSLFGARVPLDYLVKQCEAVLGPKFNRKAVEDAVARTNQKYGGYEFNADNTVFVHGTNDPWSTMGLTQPQNGAPYNVIVIEGGAHCSDVYASGEGDSFKLKEARMEILELLASWMATP